MNPIPMDTNKTRRVGIWLDLDWGLKRELEVYAGCQGFGDQAGWECTIDPILEDSLAPESGEIPYDGVIGRVSPEIADAARQADVPVVNVWLNSPVPEIPSVFNDFEGHGVLAAEHLLARGFREFGYLGYQRMRDSRGQLEGFRTRIKQEGFTCTTYRFPHTLFTASKKAPGWKKFTADLQAWIDTWTPPIGIFVCEDVICRFVIDACEAKGLSVPGDVALIGSGNQTLMCESPPPSLSSIDEGHFQKGYQAAALLESLMNGETPPRKPTLAKAAGLVPRQSTDVFAADDPLVSQALRFIAENGHLKMEVADVAAAVTTTRRTLERKFRASVGCGIAEEITRLRLERAKRRLVETDTPMKAVALASGFSSANHFSKVFLRVNGITPTQYRDERQKIFMKRGK